MSEGAVELCLQLSHGGTAVCCHIGVTSAVAVGKCVCLFGFLGPAEFGS